MKIEGIVQNGLVIPDSTAGLPEGTRVAITPIREVVTPPSTTIGQRLQWFAGSIQDMPADFSAEHDHYIHGAPRRKAVKDE